VRRSQFVAAVAGSMSAIALAPRLQRALASDVVSYRLVATPMRYSPMPGVVVDAIGYNGSIPGPLLRVTHGQRVHVEYLNHSSIATAVHWHGMVLPNAMDGAAGLTQAPIPHDGRFIYSFAPGPPGTRWYHDHAGDLGVLRGLFGMFIVDDPRDEPADVECAIVFHDVPDFASVRAAMMGDSRAPMIDPMGSPEMRPMKPDDKMGDEVRYLAHCINGATYPNTKSLRVKVGDRVRLRVLNASGTQTRYVRLAGHRLRVTHADGNPVPVPTEFDALRIGVAERYDAWFDVRKPGAWLLQGLSSDPLAFGQAMVVYTDGYENAAPLSSPQSVEGIDYLTYDKLGGGFASAVDERGVTVRKSFTLGGGAWNSPRWTLNGATWPTTPKIVVRRGDRVRVHFKNTTDMDHPMHLHGHVFRVVEIDGKPLARPLDKDTSLVRGNGGTLSWIFDADSPAGRWLLHCHNEIHMMDGMMTTVEYRL
jgi:FtsP/CotA-like multicopper oxidase with cupredoxin domain